MYGRMIHSRSPNGSLSQASQAYDVHGRFIRAVDRGGLNKRLLDELEAMPNVKFFFCHKMTGADFRKKKVWFEVTHSGEKPSSERRAPEIEVEFDLLLGADGAHSAARHHMMKFARMDFSQESIDCLWCEFTIPPSKDGDFRISPNHLHIWPAGSFMFIALPSLDKSFTCTLFGPESLFSKLGNDSKELLTLFEEHFPGVIPDLISVDDVQRHFHRNPHLPLINIKCAPHHYSDNVVILGDAANAIVPFYGQGMNAGLESVRILFSKLDQFDDRKAALAAYTDERVIDAHSIADLALSNYVEMRSSVTSPVYKIRKFVEETLYRYVPSLGWATQYSRVSFGNDRYSKVERKSKRQKAVLVILLTFMSLVMGGGSALWMWKWSFRKRGTGWLRQRAEGIHSILLKRR
jgi:kynurenine 3-monooxygenase